MNIDLDPIQLKAIGELDNGKILKGGVGSGKSRTSLAYYFLRVAKGELRINGKGKVRDFENPRDLLVITTAKKRDSTDWQGEASAFAISTKRDASFGGVKLTVDSWNNIQNYVDIEDHFIIFDEQRLVGSGAWVKAFLKMSKKNQWIMLSATPGDNWMDYIPAFIANGFYKNRTEFIRRHVVYNQYTKYPKIDDYREQGHLLKLRRAIIVDMPYKPHTKRHRSIVPVAHDKAIYDTVTKWRWNYLEERPIRNISELFSLMRRAVNSDPSRLEKVLQTHKKHPKLIVFYNFDYELHLLRAMAEEHGITYSEWNGHKHEEIPKADSWLYLVQYTAGSEAWECIETDAMLFYSLNYSYKIFEQSQGRIDRRNTPFKDLYYYILRSDSWIDMSVWKSVRAKKNFNESDYKFEKLV